jgi:hypothetical protein
MKKLTVLAISVLFFTVLTSSKINSEANDKSSSTLCVIKKVVLNKMPSLNKNGSPWDMGSGPDVYFKITSQGKKIFESGVKNDLDISTLPLTFSNGLPFTLPYLNQQYAIEFYDYENGSLLKGDKYIGGFYFNPKDYSNNSSINLSSSDLSCTIYTEWE